MSATRLNPLLIAAFLAILVCVVVVVLVIFFQPSSQKPIECFNSSADRAKPPPALALKTGLPIYWPLDFDFSDIGRGQDISTWQRAAIEQCYTLEPLDILAGDKGSLGPLVGHERLAIIQPRGLSPQDNVALDDWVEAGGQLLIALDPALTGHYDLPLGDPRLPTISALIPPVIERWGLRISFDDQQEMTVREAVFGGNAVPMSLPGIISSNNKACAVWADGAIAQCQIGSGQVTLIADAAVFEHEEIAGDNGVNLLALLDSAFAVR